MGGGFNLCRDGRLCLCEFKFRKLSQGRYGHQQQNGTCGRYGRLIDTRLFRGLRSPIEYAPYKTRRRRTSSLKNSPHMRQLIYYSTQLRPYKLPSLPDDWPYTSNASSRSHILSSDCSDGQSKRGALCSSRRFRRYGQGNYG